MPLRRLTDGTHHESERAALTGAVVYEAAKAMLRKRHVPDHVVLENSPEFLN